MSSRAIDSGDFAPLAEPSSASAGAPPEHAGQVVDGGQAFHALGQSIVGQHHHADRQARQGQGGHAEKRHVDGRRFQEIGFVRQAQPIDGTSDHMDEGPQQRDTRDEVIAVSRPARRPVPLHQPGDDEAHITEKGRDDHDPGIDVGREVGPVDQPGQDRADREVFAAQGGTQMKEAPETLERGQRGHHQQRARAQDDARRALEQQEQRGDRGQHAAGQAPMADSRYLGMEQRAENGDAHQAGQTRDADKRGRDGHGGVTKEGDPRRHWAQRKVARLVRMPSGKARIVPEEVCIPMQSGFPIVQPGWARAIRHQGRDKTARNYSA